MRSEEEIQKAKRLMNELFAMVTQQGDEYTMCMAAGFAEVLLWVLNEPSSFSRLLDMAEEHHLQVNETWRKFFSALVN